MLIDTHCHINDHDAFPDVAATVAAASAAGVGNVIVVGVDGASSQRAVELAEQFAQVFAVVGWHPNYTSKYTQEGLAKIEELLHHPKALAVGEIGLDFHWQYATLEEQRRALFDQLDLAGEAGKPIVFHCREAYPALLEILESRPVLPYLFHCFAGDQVDASRALAMDSYFGVDGPITYKKAHTLRDVIRSLPRERLVLETDAPYLSPEPFRGKPNSPDKVVLVNGGLASTLATTADVCAALTTANARRFFRF